MGGRFLDWLGQGDAASRPAAAGMAALIVPNSTAFYYANDTQILSVYDDNLVSWFDIDVGAISALSFATLPDVDWSTPPTDGQIFEWDTTSSKLIPVDKPTPARSTEQFQDDVGAMGVDGTGSTFTYDDTAGTIRWDVTITQYTDELAQDAMGAAFAAGTHVGVTATYDDAGNFISLEIVPASASECWVATSQAKVLTPKQIADMAAFVAVSDVAGTLTIDGDTGFNFSTTLDTATTFDFVNMFDGQCGVIQITQDATGGRVATWDAAQRFPGGSATNAVLSTAANAVDVLSYEVVGSVIHCALMKAMAA